MPVDLDQLQRMLDEWLDSLPWYKRWQIKAGLIGAGYMSLGGALKMGEMERGGPIVGIGCLVLILAVILGLAIAVGIAACKTS